MLRRAGLLVSIASSITSRTRLGSSCDRISACFEANLPSNIKEADKRLNVVKQRVGRGADGGRLQFRHELAVALVLLAEEIVLLLLVEQLHMGDETMRSGGRSAIPWCGHVRCSAQTPQCWPPTWRSERVKSRRVHPHATLTHCEQLGVESLLKDAGRKSSQCKVLHKLGQFCLARLVGCSARISGKVTRVQRQYSRSGAPNSSSVSTSWMMSASSTSLPCDNGFNSPVRNAKSLIMT